VLATALVESLLRAGRIEFFDLRNTDEANAAYVRALHAAGEADDPLLDAAILAHAPVIPAGPTAVTMPPSGTAPPGPKPAAAPRPPEFLAGLDAVEGRVRHQMQPPIDDSAPRRRRPRCRHRTTVPELVHLVLARSARRIQGQHPA
jgi:hypothetical protein